MMNSNSNEPMTGERLAELRAFAENIELRGRYSGLVSPSEVVYSNDVLALLAEVERLRKALAETEVERDYFHDAITEYNRVIAKIEARYEEQGQYNHELVRRLDEALQIAEAVASPWKLDRDALKALSAKARALLAQQQNGEAGE